MGHLIVEQNYLSQDDPDSHTVGYTVKSKTFLAPTGALGVTMAMSVRPSVCLSVRVCGTNLAVNLHLSRSENNPRAIRALREKSENRATRALKSGSYSRSL